MVRLLCTICVALSLSAVSAADTTNFTATVTAQLDGENYFFCREDGSPRSWRVSMDGFPYMRFTPGDRVRVDGALEIAKNRHTTRLFSARVEKIGHETSRIPTPFRRTIGELCAGKNTGRLPDPDWYGDYTSVEGRLADFYRREAMTTLILTDGADTMRLMLPISLNAPMPEDLRIGAHLRVTAPVIYSSVIVDGKRAGFVDVTAITNGLEALEILDKAPFWTMARVLVIVAVLIVILMGVMGWVFILRRAVERATKRMEQTIREKIRDKVAAEATHRERLRLSHDLHDDFQQLLASSTFRLAAAQNYLTQGAKAEEVLPLLGKVEDALAHAQTGLRAALWSIAEEAEGPSRLSELFTYAAGRLAQWNGCVRFVFEGKEPAVSSRYAGSLLMILQEAVGNALRHGGADSIVVTVTFGEDCLRMAIVDDGSGFDVSSVPTDGYGNPGAHLGLSGMRIRARNLGGSLEISSEIGRGTTVCVTVPVKS